MVLSVYAVDIDGDGDMDVLGAASGANEIAWYENNGSGTFSAKQLIGSSFDGYQSTLPIHQILMGMEIGCIRRC